MFSGLINIFKKISDIGVTPYLETEKAKHVSLCNMFAFTWIWMIIPYLFVLREDPIANYFLGALILMHIGVLFLNYIKWHDISRLVEAVIPASLMYIIAIFMYTSNLQNTTSYIIINMAFFAIPFMMFSVKEWKYITITIFWSVALYYSFDFVNPYFDNPKYNGFYSSALFEGFNYFVGVAMLMLGFVYLKRQNYLAERRIRGLLELEEKKNEEIRAQNEEIIQQREEILAINESLVEQNHRIEKQSEQLKEAYDDITDSVRYAKRIQDSMLPPDEIIKESFPESFVMFKPKDIVSGDFYWFKNVDAQTTLIAAVDCTGHGVPGAFMSIVGEDLLTQIVKEKQITQPANILDELNIGLAERLNQVDRQATVKDSMNVALCCYNNEKRQLCFSGSYHPLFLIRDNELQEMKGDRISIGDVEEGVEKFNHETLNVKKGDTVYIFSDGFPDQFGESGKKFKKRRFKELLVAMQPLTMSDQQKHLEKTLADWMGETEQTDDILMVGLRF